MFLMSFKKFARIWNEKSVESGDRKSSIDVIIEKDLGSSGGLDFILVETLFNSDGIDRKGFLSLKFESCERAYVDLALLILAYNSFLDLNIWYSLGSGPDDQTHIKHKIQAYFGVCYIMVTQDSCYILHIFEVITVRFFYVYFLNSEYIVQFSLYSW